MQPAWLRRMVVVALSLVAILLLRAPAAYASGPDDLGRQTQVDNQACLTCHSNPNLSVKLPSGETLSLYVDANTFDHSVHGQQNMRCTACHTNISGYPHPPLAVQDARAYTLQMYTLCQGCHAAEAQQTQDSIHATLIAAGNRNAATCIDCHTAHDVTPPDQPRSKIPQTCEKCHSTIYDQYKNSVHGAALLNDSNPDVPTCVDCHGVHTIADPTTNLFRLYSPQLCAKCHADTALMSKYNISTDVFATYVADFHGTTTELFAKLSPDQPVDTPVCYDCHGVHDIKKVDDPSAPVFRENLLKTCQQCHPDATGNFPAAWMGHYIASPERYPVVYYVGLFYKILIPVVVGGMVGFVLLDSARRMLNRMHKSGRSQPRGRV